MVKPVTLRRTLAEWSLRPWTWAWARRTALPLGSPALSMGPLLRPYLRPSLGRPCPLVSVVLGVGTPIVGPVPHPVSDRVAEGSSTGESFVCDFQETLPMKPQLPQGTCSLHPHHLIGKKNWISLDCETCGREREFSRPVICFQKSLEC